MTRFLSVYSGSAVALGIAAVFIACVALPLATYTTVLALFGPVHIGSELRYLDHRFGVRLGAAHIRQLAALLVLAFAARLAGMAGWLSWDLTAPAEITFAALAVLTLLRLTGPGRWGAAGLALLLLVGASLAPLFTLLLLSVTHNLTPLAFLAERLRGRARRRAVLLGSMGFLAVPLFIASGLPFAWLADTGMITPEVSAFHAAGTLEENLGVYVPAWALGQDWALHAFSASVFAQCMHYVAVIGVLPRLIPKGSTPIVAWPRAPWFIIASVAAAGAMLLGFALDYGSARKVYALVALLHAWLELPLLMLALEPSYQARA
jgi:hypothetical protein